MQNFSLTNSNSRPGGAAARPTHLLGRLAISLLVVSSVACAPKQDVADSDQCPDINYSVTELKDANIVGTDAAIDQEVWDRMLGKFPGCAVGVVDAGEIVYLKGYGVADFNVKANPNDDDDFTVNTVAGIGSVSKVLTAMATLRLDELGYIDLDDPISDHFPHAVPAGWNQVTVRDLLSHRGGFDRDPNPALAGALDDAAIDASFGEQHASQHPRYAIWEFLLTTQGSPTLADIGDYAYSNIGYTILGALVDWVTLDAGFVGGPAGYEKFVWSLVSGAQDACLTGCLDNYWRAGDIPNLAQSYDNGWNELDTDYSGWQGPAGAWSMTIGDLARILLMLDGNQVLAGASLTDMRTNPGPVGADDYGLGLFLHDIAGRDAYSHGGSIDGFRTQVVMWPNEGVGVAAFCNADRGGVGAIATAVGTTYMESSNGGSIGLSEEDEQKMRTAAYQVSEGHFDAAEPIVRELIKRYGDERTASILRRQVRRQGGLGEKLVDSAERGNVEAAADAFLRLLATDGYVGPYKPTTSGR